MVTVLLVGSMTPALVRAQASSPLARGLLDLALVVAGLVLWLPVLGRIPGIPRLKPVVRFGYLVAQAVVPAFLSFIYIFSNHPLYPAVRPVPRGRRPATAQRPADRRIRLEAVDAVRPAHRGGRGAVPGTRGPRMSSAADEPLVWADVERQFERVDRTGADPGRRHRLPGGPTRRPMAWREGPGRRVDRRRS